MIATSEDPRPKATDGLALYALAVAAAAFVGTHGIAYWDAGDYVRLAVEGRLSGLLLGRPLFLLASRTILASGLDVAHAEAALRWTWTFVSATAAPLLMSLGCALGLSRRAALWAGASLALSPVFAHTAHQVLTDGPALALTVAAITLVARTPSPGGLARPAAAGLVLAAAIATRETAAAFAPSLLLLAHRGGKRPALAAAAACALGALAIVLLAHRGPPPSLVAWGTAMERSSSLSLRGVLVAAGWLLATGPVAVLAGLPGAVRARGPLALVCAPAALATAILLAYPFASWTPRFVLSTAPLALLLPAGPWLARRPRVAAVSLAVPLVAAWWLTAPVRALSMRGQEAAARFAAVDHALVVPGHFCPQVELALAIEARKHGPRDVALLCPGWRWPADAPRALDDARCQGRTVLLDLRTDAWVGTWEVSPRELVRAYAAREGATGPVAIVPPRACR